MRGAVHADAKTRSWFDSDSVDEGCLLACSMVARASRLVSKGRCLSAAKEAHARVRLVHLNLSMTSARLFEMALFLQQPAPPTTSQHHPRPASTTHDQPAPPTTSQHHPRPASTTHDQPAPPTTSQHHSDKTHDSDWRAFPAFASKMGQMMCVMRLMIFVMRLKIFVMRHMGLKISKLP
ncbi:hypothetical protein E6O75_ATG04846 [Venturia nashicola]|uniref:Uncharacterized protein n=1 Tax=Venturia nashicola TaxID=86259 RepID=A0A4Z1P958_9PEZI|nr:hypothetical protein E6O75_ATG04846 [Venturia nashicola]